MKDAKKVLAARLADSAAHAKAMRGEAVVEVKAVEVEPEETTTDAGSSEEGAPDGGDSPAERIAES